MKELTFEKCKELYKNADKETLWIQKYEEIKEELELVKPNESNNFNIVINGLHTSVRYGFMKKLIGLVDKEIDKHKTNFIIQFENEE